MKPEGALTFTVQADLSGCALDMALEMLKCFPIFTLRVSTTDVAVAQRIIGVSVPEDFEGAVTFPRVNIVIDETFKPYEWQVEYNDKIFWCQGP